MPLVSAWIRSLSHAAPGSRSTQRPSCFNSTPPRSGDGWPRGHLRSASWRGSSSSAFMNYGPPSMANRVNRETRTSAHDRERFAAAAARRGKSRPQNRLSARPLNGMSDGRLPAGPAPAPAPRRPLRSHATYVSGEASRPDHPRRNSRGDLSVERSALSAVPTAISVPLPWLYRSGSQCRAGRELTELPGTTVRRSPLRT